MLQSVHIAGFKSIREQTLEFGRVNVLIGPNGAGKSNLVSFFRMLEWSMKGNLQLFVAREGGSRDLLFLGPKVTKRIAYDLRFADGPWTGNYRVELHPAARDALVYGDESLNDRSDESRLQHRSLLSQGESQLFDDLQGGEFRHGEGTLSETHRFLAGCRTFHFHDTSAEAGIRLKSDPSEGSSLRSRGENLAAFLFRLREERRPYYDRIVATVRQVAPFFRDFDLAPDAGRKVMLTWRGHTSEYEFGPHQLSDGTLRFMAMAALLLQPEEDLPRLIVLDEPELGLHPFALNVFAGLVQQASEHCQVLLATQSPQLLDNFEADQVIVVDMVGGESQFHRLDAERLREWREDDSLSDLWNKNVLGGRPSALELPSAPR